MEEPFIAACLQVTAGSELQANVEAACVLARDAAEAGARLILLPENVSMMESDRRKAHAKAAIEKDHPALAAFRNLARECGVWLHCGTIAVRRGEKLVNRTYVLNPEGDITARYDKIHMFDVDLGGKESHRESDTFEAGGKAVIAPIPWGGLGLTVCYDLRFPHLYRALAQSGASFLAVPSAFTKVTGEAHWHVLLRARAIETGCYVLAPAQTGSHDNGRKTFGHSLIVDPWGEVLADAKTKPGFITAKIDPARVIEARTKIPALKHDRPFALP